MNKKNKKNKKITLKKEVNKKLKDDNKKITLAIDNLAKYDVIVRMITIFIYIGRLVKFIDKVITNISDRVPKYVKVILLGMVIYEILSKTVLVDVDINTIAEIVSLLRG